MTEVEKQAYIDLLNTVQEDAAFLADMAQRIRDHVAGIQRRVSKIKDDLEGE
jgi:hypothetical protein